MKKLLEWGYKYNKITGGSSHERFNIWGAGQDYFEPQRHDDQGTCGTDPGRNWKSNV